VNTLQHNTTLQHSATHCNTLQYIRISQSCDARRVTSHVSLNTSTPPASQRHTIHPHMHRHWHRHRPSIKHGHRHRHRPSRKHGHRHRHRHRPSHKHGHRRRSAGSTCHHHFQLHTLHVSGQQRGRWGRVRCVGFMCVFVCMQRWCVRVSNLGLGVVFETRLKTSDYLESGGLAKDGVVKRPPQPRRQHADHAPALTSRRTLKIIGGAKLAAHSQRPSTNLTKTTGPSRSPHIPHRQHTMRRVVRARSRSLHSKPQPRHFEDQ